MILAFCTFQHDNRFTEFIRLSPPLSCSVVLVQTEMYIYSHVIEDEITFGYLEIGYRLKSSHLGIDLDYVLRIVHLLIVLHSVSLKKVCILDI